MGNSLAICRRTSQEEIHEDDSGSEKSGGVRIDHSMSAEPSEVDGSPLNTPEGYSGMDLRKSQLMVLGDPRSPNEDINRTPILIVDEEPDLKRKIKNRFLHVNRAIHQASLDGGSECTTPVGNVGEASAGFDPRSPTQGFNRTPVVPVQKTDTVRMKPLKLQAQED